MRMLVTCLWPSLAHPRGTAQTPAQAGFALPKADFAKLIEKWSQLLDLLWVWAPTSGIQKAFRHFRSCATSLQSLTVVLM